MFHAGTMARFEPVLLAIVRRNLFFARFDGPVCFFPDLLDDTCRLLLLVLKERQEGSRHVDDAGKVGIHFLVE